jgi:ABC-type polysaccharide/polyol phosphate transport system ATPase subunit
MCDRALWIADGVIRSEGETAAVLEDYRRSLAPAGPKSRTH